MVNTRTNSSAKGTAPIKQSPASKVSAEPAKKSTPPVKKSKTAPAVKTAKSPSSKKTAAPIKKAGRPKKKNKGDDELSDSSSDNIPVLDLLISEPPPADNCEQGRRKEDLLLQQQTSRHGQTLVFPPPSVPPPSAFWIQTGVIGGNPLPPPSNAPASVLPEFIVLDRARRTKKDTLDKDSLKLKHSEALPSLTANADNTSIEAWLCAADQYAYYNYGFPAVYDNISSLLKKMHEPYKAYVESILNDQHLVTWDEFIIGFYCNYWDAHNKGESIGKLNSTRMRGNQTVLQFSVYFKKLVSKTGIDPESPFLGQIFYQALTPPIIAEHAVFPTNTPLADAIVMAFGAESKKDAIAHLQKRSHDGTAAENAKKPKLSTISCKPRFVNGPMGTPTGYLEMDPNSKLTKATV